MDGVVESFGQRCFGTLDLGDKRRTKRLVDVADCMYRHPGSTLPDKMGEPARLRALYRLMDCDDVTHKRIMDGHTQATKRTMTAIARESPGTVFLILHDATELDYTSLASLADQLGQIGEGTHRGYICHNSLVVQAEPQMVLGLGSQILHHRADVPANETTKQARERKNRESLLWLKGASNCGPMPPGVFCVDVSDSLSDTFEYMAYEIASERHFVLRSRENRKLAAAVAGKTYLYEAVREQAAVAKRTIVVQGTDKQLERSAEVSVSFIEVKLAPPSKKSGHYKPRPLSVWAIRVWEKKPPAGADALEWILLTNVPVTVTADAEQRVDWYECRPIVEDYHKAQKTGCGIETLQFTEATRLEPAIALISSVATMLLRLRDAARQPDADVRPANEVFAQEYIDVIQKPSSTRAPEPITVRQFLLRVARLGGHQNRKGDGLPGWITLWRGWMKLELQATGYRIAMRRAAARAKTCGKT